MIQIPGFCPMGCGERLVLTEADTIICCNAYCKRPNAAQEILNDSETEHIVEFKPNGFTICHPLRERLDDALMRCYLHECLSCWGKPSGVNGIGPFRVTRGDSNERDEMWIYRLLT